VSASEHERGPITVRAHAKINLFLEVFGRRPDGYHDVATALQAISLADRLVCTYRRSPHLTLSVSPPNPDLERDDNLVLKAARALRAYTGVIAGAAVDLEKRIPTAAGMGGGSADAAAALIALNLLWHLRLRRPELLSIAASLGSDVPYFVQGHGTALCEGRGERVTALPPSMARDLVLITLPIPVTTAVIFQSLEPADIRLRRPGNALQAPAERLFPKIGEARRLLEGITQRSVSMSGSGPTLYCLGSSPGDAEAIAVLIQNAGFQAQALSTVSHPMVIEQR